MRLARSLDASGTGLLLDGSSKRSIHLLEATSEPLIHRVRREVDEDAAEFLGLGRRASTAPSGSTKHMLSVEQPGEPEVSAPP